MDILALWIISIHSPTPICFSFSFFFFFKCNLKSFSQREVLKVLCGFFGDGIGKKKKKSLKEIFSFYLGLYLWQSGDH